jgi:hypothetical protein
MNDAKLPPRLRLARTLFFICGAWLVGLGMYFIFIRPPLLPEDPRFMGATLAQIQQGLPGLAGWLRMVFTVMGGFMATAGLLTLHTASRLRSETARGALPVLALAGLTGVGLMSAVNFALHSDFRWLLVGPPLLWLLGVAALATASRVRSN